MKLTHDQLAQLGRENNALAANALAAQLRARQLQSTAPKTKRRSSPSHRKAGV